MFKLIGVPQTTEFERVFPGIQIARLKEAFLNTMPAHCRVHMAADLEAHIRSRIGAPGQGFQQILQQARAEIMGGLVPHVFFTCTPITANYDVYQNGNAVETDSNGQPQSPHKFYLNGYEFSEANSRAHFGSLQLCLDVLTQHELVDEPTGNLLDQLFNRTQA